MNCRCLDYYKQYFMKRKFGTLPKQIHGSFFIHRFLQKRPLNTTLHSLVTRFMLTLPSHSESVTVRGSQGLLIVTAFALILSTTNPRQKPTKKTERNCTNRINLGLILLFILLDGKLDDIFFGFNVQSSINKQKLFFSLR